MMATHYTFPVATHSYFRALNKRSQMKAFLAGTISEPTFRYRETVTPELIKKRIGLVKDDLVIVNRLELVLASLYLQKDAKKLSEFRNANSKIFRTPDKDLVLAILCRMSKNVAESDQHLWNEVLELIRIDTFESDWQEPSRDVFKKYRAYLKQYTKISHLGDNLEDALYGQLSTTGLIDKGWRLRVLKGSEHARTYHKAKTISIGKDYAPRTASAIERITLHEVIGHAVRGPQPSMDEAEGFAILLEQLTKPSFGFRRTYRYLAIALGWGVLGHSMTFREVYEILWRLMVCHSKYSVEAAKEHSFNECYRAFRGGRPDIAGAVYLKDAVYFDANIRMWNILSKSDLSYNEFVDIIEGRRTVLS